MEIWFSTGCWDESRTDKALTVLACRHVDEALRRTFAVDHISEEISLIALSGGKGGNQGNGTGRENLETKATIDCPAG